MRIAQIQYKVFPEKEKNLEQAKALMQKIREEVSPMPDLVAFGEMFCCPYETKRFPEYAEKEGGATWQVLSRLAKQNGVYLSAGSVPEGDEEGNIYNTAYVFDREGRQLAKHRKVHLFDINVKGGQSFRESDTLTAGKTFEVFETEFGKMGICICFDARFPEGIRLQVLEGARLILCPAAFNMTTGPMHWELMFRSRAVDNQCYMIGTAPARDEQADYVAYGHSIVVSPWGEVVSEADETEQIIVTDISMEMVEAVREQLPLLSARRTDVYQLKGVRQEEE